MNTQALLTPYLLLLLFTAVSYAQPGNIDDREFPKEEKYGLVSQITRSASSIPANIAEGSSRKSDREYAHFLQISLGSCFELETHILLSELLGFGLINIRKSILYKIDEEQKMLISFIDKLNK